MALWSLGWAMHRAARISGVLLAVGVIVTMASAPVAAQPAVTATWTVPSIIPSAMTYGGGPALATYDGRLYAAWQGAAWSRPRPVPQAMSLVSPGLAGYEGSLYEAWTPDTENSPIDYSVRS